MNVKNLMQQINEWVKGILKDNYVGVYFHGSLRLGSFNPKKSDLDFIIVVKDRLDNRVKESLWDKMLENITQFPGKGFEFSVVLEKYCKNIQYPIPYELHGSRDWIEKYKTNKELIINDNYKVDSDLASHFNVIGVKNNEMDFGEPSSEVFEKIPREFVIDSNYRDILDCVHNIKNNPAYCILNLCRFYALIKDNLTLSKYDGGKWAIENIDPEYHDAIESALEDYSSDVNTEYDNGKLQDFAAYMMRLINECLPTQSIRLGENVV